MIIREATRADSPRLVAMTERFLATTRYGDVLGAADVEMLEALIGTVIDHGVIFVADIEGRLEGMLGIVALVHPVTGEPYGEELAWWVEPEARARSIGPRLLKTGEDWARARSLTRLKMVAPVGSGVGAFYQRCGYHPVEVAYLKVF